VSEQAEKERRFPDAASEEDRENDGNPSPVLTPGVAGGDLGGISDLTDKAPEPPEAEEYSRKDDRNSRRQFRERRE
jgi:hypothetical protein